jgi:hypothetical protein
MARALPCVGPSQTRLSTIHSDSVKAGSWAGSIVTDYWLAWASASVAALRTAEGFAQIRNCLFARTESDLRTPLRAGASDEQIAERWTQAVAVKLPANQVS